MSKMNKADLYKLCKELQEENKRLQFDNNCLEEEKEKLKEENIKLDGLWEEEFQCSKSKSQDIKKYVKIIKQLLEADDILKPTPQGNSD